MTRSRGGCGRGRWVFGGVFMALVIAGGGVARAQTPAAGGRLRVGVEPSFVTVSEGERPILRYRYEGAPFKPYVKELFTPKDVNVLLDSPADHVHHHGLMYAIKVNEVNFWEEVEQAGKEAHRALQDVAPAGGQSADTAAFSEQVDWLSPDGTVVMHERRTIRVHGGKQVEAAGATLLTWKTRLEPAPGQAEATLGGNHYHGLGMRFIDAMAKNGKFLNAENAPGEVFRGDERLTPAKWCAYQAAIDGKPVTVAMFAHPDNARPPTTWFTMKEPFAYMSATMRLHKEPLALKADKPLELCYGVALWDDRVEAERIEKVYQLWATQFAAKGDAGTKSETKKPSP